MNGYNLTRMRLIGLSLLCSIVGVVAPARAADFIVGDAGTDTYDNLTVHDISGNLILGNQVGGDGTYTITGDSAQTNINLVSGGNGGSPNGALIVGNGGAGSFIQGTDVLTDSNNQVNVAGDLTLGQQSTGTGTYVLNSGTLTVGGQLAVGGTSQNANSFTQNSGAVILSGLANGPNVNNPDYAPVGGSGFNPWGGALAVGGGVGNGDGSNGGGTGTYNLNDGTINSYNLLIGPTGTGTMNQSGGAVTTEFMTLGFDAGGNGTYVLSGGALLANSGQAVGGYGIGTFIQSGGTNTVFGTLGIGDTCCGSSGSGTYTMTGGTLTTGDMIVGSVTQGTFTLSDTAAASTHTVNGNLIVGGQVDGNGSYTITGNSQTIISFVPGGNGGNPNGALIVGEFGTGSFTQGLADQSDSPTVTVAGDLILGHQGLASGQVADSVGTYTINSGVLTVGGNIGVGTASTAVDGSGNPLNVFTQNGGTVTITGSANGNPDYVGVGTNDHTGALFIGGGAGPNNDGGTGAYVMTGGALNVGLIEVGHAGVGVMTQSGDSIVNASIWLGNAGGSNGTYNLNSGAINADGILVALFGDGTFNQTGGVNTISDTLNVGYASGQGTYNLSGGSVISGSTIIGDGASNRAPADWSYNGPGGVLNISGTASLTTGDMRIGVLNSGTVNQSGGNVSAASLTLGEIGTNPNGSGYYNLTGTGQLNVSGDVTIGQFGYGQFTQGTIGDLGLTNNTVTGDLILGASDNIHPNDGPQPRAGVYVLNTGSLSTNNTIIGSLGVGTFTQNGGTHTVANGLVIGDQSIPSDSTACGGACTSGGPSEGTYSLNGGMLSVGQDMTVGNAGNGVLTVNDGTVAITGTLQIGVNGTGTVTQSGGVVTASFVDLSTPVGGGSSSYALIGGTLHTTADLNVGGGGTGPAVFTQTGGAANVDGVVRIGNSIGNASYTLSGGALTTNGLMVGFAGTGTFTQTGGTHTVSGTGNPDSGNVVIAASAGSAGTYNLSGGTLVASNVINNGTFNYSGGSLTLGGGTGLTNNAGGQVNFSGPGMRVVNGKTDNQSGGTIIVANGTSASFLDSLRNNGVLTVDGAANFSGLVSGAGQFNGSGAATFHGGFAPGNSPAVVTVGFASTYSSTSTILMELGGTTAGNLASNHDQVIFTSLVTLQGGTLNVAWYNGYTGLVGDQFDLFVWNGGVSGSFGSVVLPTLSSGLTWRTQDLYTTGDISVMAVPEPETYVMMLAGLGLLGLMIRRRKAAHH